jgi:hypothetical protein
VQCDDRTAVLVTCLGDMEAHAAGGDVVATDSGNGGRFVVDWHVD